ncbi:UBX domain-containing protein 10 [Mucor velutinosus]|uniref:UBX domain-containing protein 10 n=1 Tax=Mucor velutinosus TaxID=708070 RepID=A0AAN7HKJ4_9FUNG|nr:UBX domain-containing protein 10 [Mucor velutinosus]
MSVVPFQIPENHGVSSDSQKKENPAACVFVARDLKDADLKTSVYEHFLKWGPIMSVKVFKDWLERPYAFVQYEAVDDCKQALREAPKTSIHGRRIRCEPARVNRSICLISLNQPFSKKHVANILSEYGEIEDMNILQPHGKFHSIIIKFKFRDDAIRAYTKLKFPQKNIMNERSHQQWFVEWAAYLNNDNVYGVCGTTCRLDKHTIFIGNLPESINEEDLFIKFTKYGHILDIHLIRKPVYRHTYKKVFAFLKYQGEKETKEAIDSENGALYKDKVIRVCYRQYPCNNHYNNRCNYQINSTSMPYLGYNNSDNNNNNKAFSSINGIEYNNGYHNNVYPTPPSNGYYVDPYSTIIYTVPFYKYT